MTQQGMGQLAGRTAIITGASRGIGRGIAELFLAEGANVVGGDIEVIPPIAGAGNRFHTEYCDVTRDEHVAALVAEAVERHGRVDCLVSNAANPGPIEGIADIDPDAFDATVSVVLRSVYLGLRHVTPVMREQGGGSIIHIGSTSALTASSVLQPYGAAKAGVAMLTRTAAVELAIDAIRVNCICPGGIATALYGLSAGLSVQAAEMRCDVVAKNLADILPLGRAGTPHDVAQAALWLAGDRSSFVTGQVIAVDGGLSVGRPMPPGVTPAQFFKRIAGIAPDQQS